MLNVFHYVFDLNSHGQEGGPAVYYNVAGEQVEASEDDPVGSNETNGEHATPEYEDLTGRSDDQHYEQVQLEYWNITRDV